MNVEFWHERWEANQLGFHQSEANALLGEHWRKLGIAPDAPVFVPLCGKSLDMHWLRAVGHPIIGIEISDIAIRDFFAEAGIESATIPGGALACSSGGSYDLYCGDFFSLESAQLTDVRAVYDRASLIALPPKMRIRYAKHLANVLPSTVSILLITIEYDQSRMKGPPHSVPPDEVERLFGAEFEIERLWSSGPERPTARFQERGLDVWRETVWRLERGAIR